MGTWDVPLREAQAAWIQLSPSQRDVLFQGGDVIFLEGLPEPFWQTGGSGADMTTRDDAGYPVFFASIMASFPVDGPVPDTGPYAHGGAGTFAEYIDKWGNLKIRNVWRRWPSATGYMYADFETDMAAAGLLAEDILVRRIWDCLPVEDVGLDVALGVVKASWDRIKGSPWLLIKEFSELDEYWSPTRPNPDLTPETAAANLRKWHRLRYALRKHGMWDEELRTAARADSPLHYPSVEEVTDEVAVINAWNLLSQQALTGTQRALEAWPVQELTTYLLTEKVIDPWF